MATAEHDHRELAGLQLLELAGEVSIPSEAADLPERARVAHEVGHDLLEDHRQHLGFESYTEKN